MKRRSSYIDPGNKTDLAPDTTKGGRKVFFGENQNPFFNRSANSIIQKKSGEGSSPKEDQVQSDDKSLVQSAAGVTKGATQNDSATKTPRQFRQGNL